MTNAHTTDIHDYLKSLDTVPEIFRNSWDAIAVYDLEGRFVAGNGVARALVGEELAATLAGQHFTAHLTLEAATKAAHDFAHCVTHGETVDSASIFRDSDGRAVPVRLRLVPARVKGKIVGIVSFARDGRAQRSKEEQFMRSEQQFRSLFENHPDALALHDLEGRFLRVNAASERLTGYSVEELVGQTPAILAPGGWDDGERIRAAILRGDSIEFEHLITTKTGAVREIDGRAVPLHVDGHVRGWCGMIRDVTEARRSARSSARQATRIAELYRIAAAASVATDEKIMSALEAGMSELGSAWACVVRVRDGVAETAYTAGTGGAPFARGGAGDRSPLHAALEHDDVFVIAEQSGGPPAFAGAPLSVEGQRYGAVTFALGTQPLHIAPAEREYMRALASLIGSAIQQNEREKRLDSLAFGDSLTGLPNRALLQDRLEQTLLSARRHRRSFAAHYIDVDHFKAINDSFGHQVGDGVLVAVAAWLRSKLRDSDTIGRIGGDEFVVLQPEIDSPKQAEDLAAKLCSIRAETFRVGPRDIRVTVSVGCSVFPVDAENPVDMLRAADAALYDVKHRGRDGYALA
jgi:diguanylate cyclase (GGDEF)-like protein/PAS domain S-box-containing protein